MLSVLNLMILRLGVDSVEDFADLGLLGQILLTIPWIFARKLQAHNDGARDAWWENSIWEIGGTG